MASVNSQNRTVYNSLLLKGDGGVFQKFEYISDPYENSKVVENQRREVGNMKI